MGETMFKPEKRFSPRLCLPLLLISLLLISLLSMAGCSDDDDPTSVLKWDLTITNNTAVTYDIWQDAGMAGTEFTLVDQVNPVSSRVLANRTVGVTYTYRLALAGEAVGQYEHETVISSDGENKSWIVP